MADLSLSSSNLNIGPLGKLKLGQLMSMVEFQGQNVVQGLNGVMVCKVNKIQMLQKLKGGSDDSAGGDSEDAHAELGVEGSDEGSEGKLNSEGAHAEVKNVKESGLCVIANNAPLECSA